MKENFFSFDKIGGEYPLFGEDIRRGTPTAVFGVADSLKYLLAALLPFPVVYITADAVAAQRAAENPGRRSTRPKMRSDAASRSSEESERFRFFIAARSSFLVIKSHLFGLKFPPVSIVILQTMAIFASGNTKL